MEQVSKIFALVGLILLLVNIKLCNCFSSRIFDPVDPVIGANSAAEIVRNWGLASEIHEVVSEDGYFTQLLRIPNNGSNCKLPTILHHGLMCSSADWLVQDPENALPHMLWKAGFDVWIPSARGTKPSQKHLTLETNNVKYWKFSMNEIGRYDVPATIDYVLEKTGAAKVNWVGHSMGCAVLHIAFHYKPEYNKKIGRFVAIAPGVYNTRASAIATRIMSLVADSIHEELADRLYNGRAFAAPLMEVIRPFIPMICSTAINPMAQLICGNFLFLFAGHLSLDVLISAKVLARALSWTPAETSMRAITHYISDARCDTFGHKTENSNGRSIKTSLMELEDLSEMYMQLLQKSQNAKKLQRGLFFQFSLNPILPTFSRCETTKYLLNRTEVPILLIYGNRDGLIHPQDAERTLSETGSLTAGLAEILLLQDYQHMDFLYAETAQKLVYEPTIQYLNRDCLMATPMRNFAFS